MLIQSISDGTIDTDLQARAAFASETAKSRATGVAFLTDSETEEAGLPPPVIDRSSPVYAKLAYLEDGVPGMMTEHKFGSRETKKPAAGTSMQEPEAISAAGLSHGAPPIENKDVQSLDRRTPPNPNYNLFPDGLPEVANNKDERLKRLDQIASDRGQTYYMFPANTDGSFNLLGVMYDLDKDGQMMMTALDGGTIVIAYNSEQLYLLHIPEQPFFLPDPGSTKNFYAWTKVKSFLSAKYPNAEYGAPWLATGTSSTGETYHLMKGATTFVVTVGKENIVDDPDIGRNKYPRRSTQLRAFPAEELDAPQGTEILFQRSKQSEQPPRMSFEYSAKTRQLRIFLADHRKGGGAIEVLPRNTILPL